MTRYQTDALYSLKGEVVSRGIRALTGIEMPVNEKRRFQHGALPQADLHTRIPADERALRRQFLSLYA